MSLLRYWLSLAQAAGVLVRIFVLPKGRPITFGFFVNDGERSTHLALADDLFPGATLIRVSFPRARRGWTAAQFTKLLNMLAAMTSGRRVDAIVWGYRDRMNHGVDVGSYFDRCWRVERALVEPTNAAGNAFVAGYRSIYFDGRESTDLERQLNALVPGSLSQSPDGMRLLAHILSRSLTKYQGTFDLTARPTDRDLLIVGQCTSDQAIEETDALTRDNPGLVDLAAKHLLTQGAFEHVYYKPHPRNHTTLSDLAYIRERYPRIEIIDASCSIVPALEDRPTVAVLTSGVGLEAAVRGCRVHTFGIPFYSHWGFTLDHMPCERRTNRLSAEDVLLYVVMRHTRYADPRTQRPMKSLQAFGLTPSAP